jgi:pyrroline-5-carboxylate reductase
MSAAIADSWGKVGDPAGGRSVGIVGAGRLGSALALALIGRGLPRASLLLSTQAGEASKARLADLGLADRLAVNAEVALTELARVFRWVPAATPVFSSEAERRAYIDRMVTPGGVTERIVSSLDAGRRARAAFHDGVVRARGTHFPC